jgi:hypothetical protein
MLGKVLLAGVAYLALGWTNAQAQDLALNQPATASSTDGGLFLYRPANANDGSSSTRWSSNYLDHQWWEVDLGAIRSINRVELNWGAEYARRYRIRTRTSTSASWSTAARIRISSPGLKTHTFATRNARYVRIQGDMPATPWGISLWDVRVCNVSCSGPPPPPPRDSDGDGVPDADDDCVNEPGPVSNGGCPVSPDPPTADFSVSPSPSNPGQPVTFDWTGGCPADPCSAVWEDEGPDGSGGTEWPWGAGNPLVKTFQSEGTKYVHLVVTDALGRTAEARREHVVRSSPPPPDPQCADGSDNDGDGRVDLADPGCSSSTDGSESPDPPPSDTCDLNATPSNFVAQVSGAATGQTICLASGDYGTFQGTNKAITIKRADGATPTMRISFGSGDSGFTLDGMAGMGGTLASGVSGVTVKNSAFNTCTNFGGSMTNVVFDSNTHININATCGNSRLGLGASGVTVRNSLMQGGDADGAFISANNVLVENNRFINICDGPTGNHADGLQFADPNGWPTPGDSGNNYGYNAVVRHNFFQFNDCNNGYAQGLTSYDSGTQGALIEDNVIDTTRPWGIELYSDDGSIVRHNTVRYYPDSQCGFSGLVCGQIDLRRKTEHIDAAGSGTQVYDNVGIVSLAEGSTTARNDHNVSGALVTYVGPLNAWDGFHIADGSAGKNAASDGLDVGIR